MSSLWGNLCRNLRADSRLLTGDLQLVLVVIANKKGQEEVVGAILMALCYRIPIIHTKVPVTALGVRLLGAVVAWPEAALSIQSSDPRWKHPRAWRSFHQTLWLGLFA